MNKTGLAVALALLAVLVGCPTEETPTPEETVLVAVGEPAPSFEVMTLDGATFNLDEQRGKVVLVNFFATWCPPCREELPHLEEEVWQRFSNDRFTLVVVGREEGDDVLKPFMDQHSYSFPVAGDPDRAVYSRYASRYIPRNVVIGPDGTILFQSQGYERAEFDRMVEVIEGAVAAIDPPEAEAT